MHIPIALASAEPVVTSEVHTGAKGDRSPPSRGSSPTGEEQTGPKNSTSLAVDVGP